MKTVTIEVSETKLNKALNEARRELDERERSYSYLIVHNKLSKARAKRQKEDMETIVEILELLTGERKEIQNNQQSIFENF